MWINVRIKNAQQRLSSHKVINVWIKRVQRRLSSHKMDYRVDKMRNDERYRQGRVVPANYVNYVPEVGEGNENRSHKMDLCSRSW